MISKEQLEEIYKRSQMDGYKASIHDVAYLILNRELKDARMSFSILYGDSSEEEARTYDTSSDMAIVRKAMNDVVKPNARRRDDSSILENDISFEENKAELIALLERARQAVASGELAEKDALKIEADIRTKLVDKFGTTETSEAKTIVVVPPVFDIERCPITHHECAWQTKERCMEHYNLMEKP